MTDLFKNVCDENNMRCLNFFNSRSPFTMKDDDDDDVHNLHILQSSGATAMATIYKLVPLDEVLIDSTANPNLRECLHSLYDRMNGNENLRRLLHLINASHRYTFDHEQFVNFFLSWKSEYSILAENPKSDEYLCCLLLTVVHNALPDYSRHVLGISDENMKRQVMLRVKATDSFCAQRDELEQALDYVPHCFLSLSVIACVLFLPKEVKDRKDAMQRCLSCCNRLVDDNSSYLRTSSRAGYLFFLHALLLETIFDLFFDSPALAFVQPSLSHIGSVTLASPNSAFSTPSVPYRLASDALLGRCISPSSALLRSFSEFGIFKEENDGQQQMLNLTNIS